jgi:uncharacterized protein (TIGR02596 family)
VAIFAAVALPAFNHLNKSSALTTSAGLIADQLTAARQTALSRNRIVEIRFYKLPGELAGSATAFRAFRVFLYDEKVQAASALTGVVKLAPGVIIPDDQNFSTIINTSSNIRTLSPVTDTLPGITNQVAYQAFRFRSNGATDLDPGGAPNSDKWFLTVKAEVDPVSGTQPAHNFITLMIDPVSGRIRQFRP